MKSEESKKFNKIYGLSDSLKDNKGGDVMTEKEIYNINLVNTFIDNYLADKVNDLLEEDLGHTICDGMCNPEPNACDTCVYRAHIKKLEDACEANDANLNEIANELRTALHLFIHKKFGGK
jgi:hypothetical protein